ncbi:MAG: hypothetical protein JRJ66_12265, partial [Deltaproteobacteria bacterium]|nr:hypothetical protein [Deltaproteobacteria bacterium]
GKMLGGTLGRKWAGVNVPSGIYLGMGLLPQAGLAIGLSTWAAREKPDVGAALLSTILATTVVFEVAGPILTKHSLVKGGEVKIVNPPFEIRFTFAARSNYGSLRKSTFL